MLGNPGDFTRMLLFQSVSWNFRKSADLLKNRLKFQEMRPNTNLLPRIYTLVQKANIGPIAFVPDRANSICAFGAKEQTRVVRFVFGLLFTEKIHQ